MKTRLLPLMAAAFTLSAAPAAFAVALVGIYDENTIQTNSVDQSAVFASGTGGASAANTLNYAAFKTNVEAGFGLGFGGVLNFDSVINIDDQLPGTGIVSPFVATFGSKSLQLSVSLSSGTNVFRQMNLSNRTPISAGNGAVPGGALNTQTETPGIMTWTFGSLTGGAPDERVTQAGFTFLSRASRDYGLVSATAIFDNGATVTSTFTNTIFTAGAQDTFFGFIAPAGSYITSFTLGTVGGQQFSIDDLGIVTSVIPEPRSVVLVLCGLACALLRRRRC